MGRHVGVGHEGRQSGVGGRRTGDGDDGSGGDDDGGGGNDGGVGEVGKQRFGQQVRCEQQGGDPPIGVLFLGEVAGRRMWRRNDGGKGGAGGVGATGKTETVGMPLFVETKRERCNCLLLGCSESQEEALVLQDPLPPFCPCPHHLRVSCHRTDSHCEGGGKMAVSDWQNF